MIKVLPTTKILFLDDEIKRIELFLSSYPQSDIVSTADDCIKRLNESNYDLLFADHDLEEPWSIESKNSGSEVIRWIVKNKPKIGLIVIHSMNYYGMSNMKGLLEQDGTYTFQVIPFCYLLQNIENDTNI